MTRYEIYRSQVARRLHSAAWLMFNIGSKLSNTDMLAAVWGIEVVAACVHPKPRYEEALSVSRACEAHLKIANAFVRRLSAFLADAVRLLDSGDSVGIENLDARPRTHIDKIIIASVQSALITAAIYWPHKE